MNLDPFKEYFKETEPDKRSKGYAWHTAIGLQDVDGIKTSEYLMRTAIGNIEGEISMEEASALVRANYNHLRNGVYETTEFLELFLRNLLLDEKNPLQSREMHISISK